MNYRLIPQSGFITVIPLKPSEVKEYTGKLLADVETTGMDVLQYGRVVAITTSNGEFKGGYAPDDIVLYPKLASDKTNFGEPRQVIVEVGHVKAYLLKVVELDELADIVDDSTDVAEYGNES